MLGKALRANLVRVTGFGNALGQALRANLVRVTGLGSALGITLHPLFRVKLLTLRASA